MARSREQLSAMNAPHPDFQAAYTARPVNLPPSSPDVNRAREARRAHLDGLVKDMPIPGPIPDAVAESEVFVRANDGYEIPVTVYSPTGPGSTAEQSGLPVIMLMHEGSWRLGDRKDEEMNARLFVRELDCVVLNVEYRLAPEHQFPIYVNDCYAVLTQLASSPQSFHDLAKPELGVVLGGSSAGGNLAAVLVHKAREGGLRPPVTGQWLSVAVLLPEEVVPEKYMDENVSGGENRDDPVIGRLTSERWKGMERTLGIKNIDDADYSPFATSLYPPKEDGKGKLAKAFLQVAGMDPLRDHSLIYERALREEWSTETRLVIYEGHGHMFWTNWPEIEESKRYWRDMVEGMRWLLRQ